MTTSAAEWAAAALEWVRLRDVLALVASRLEVTVDLAAPILQAGLRSGAIRSRILPDLVHYDPPPGQQAKAAVRALMASMEAGGVPIARRQDVAGNGGWEAVDWVAGTVNRYPVEVAFEDVQAALSGKAVSQAPPKKPVTVPAAKIQAWYTEEARSGRGWLDREAAIPACMAALGCNRKAARDAFTALPDHVKRPAHRPAEERK